MSWHHQSRLLIRSCLLRVRLLREDVGRCTFTSHCAPAFLSDACHHTLHHCWLRSTGEGDSFLFIPCSYGFLISPPTIFGVRFSLLTLRFRRVCLCHFRSRSIVSHHSTDGEILARSLSLPLLWGFASSFQMELDAYGASLVEESFTLHLSLHSRPSLCTHEAVSSVRSNVFCVHDIWLLRLLFNFSIAKLRQDVYLKYRLGYLHHKNIGNLPHFPVWLLVKRVFQHFC